MGFHVPAMKPAHAILRFNPDDSLKRRQTGKLLYARVDNELLKKIPPQEIIN
jgi:hypothetical protein